ncbi:hypothetical protein Poli38472_009815 [Pythium oligandrum]|uniref:Uncharacterized protein n=1 Tax=Pythium oligandrum TaxID=41045 RepID=A0A8K1CHP4_PYTOL|nr:hypothetical protein Poli38472_009815 [Pythium oligandrum]|eukprot:TMW62322.1 hypothetical protein Poli38472_009815 [Pythium oligandrum]
MRCKSDGQLQRGKRSEWTNGNMPPTKEALMTKLATQHSEFLREYAELRRVAAVMETRATCADARLRELSVRLEERVEDASDERTGRIQELTQQNERMHAELAAIRIELVDRSRVIADQSCRITELEAELDRVKRSEEGLKAQRQHDQQQIKALRSSIRALERELISSTTNRR